MVSVKTRRVAVPMVVACVGLLGSTAAAKAQTGGGLSVTPASLENRWVIEGQWKLIAPHAPNVKDAKPQLYDLSRDPTEQNDLAAQDRQDDSPGGRELKNNSTPDGADGCKHRSANQEVHSEGGGPDRAPDRRRRAADPGVRRRAQRHRS